MKTLKRKIYLVLVLLFLVSCKNEKTEHDKNIQDSVQNHSKEIKNDAFEFSAEENKTLKKWKNYYRKIDSDFNLDKFEFQNSSELEFMKGNVLPNYDKNFDAVYEPFLIFSPSGNYYLDLDSYHWQLDKTKNQPMFNPDQEINLVSLKDSLVQRIAFYGPSFTVEDAYWKTDQKIIFLEGTYENSPNISLIDLEEKRIYSYSYPDTLPGKSTYKEVRIQEKLE